MTTQTKRPLNKTIVKSIGWIIMTLLAILLFIMVAPYLTGNPAFFFEEQRVVYIAHTTGIVVHVGGAMLAILIGPFQFLPKSITRRYLNLHRWMGRIYLMAVFVGSIAGLYMATFAYGGFSTRVGFALLAISWFVSGFMAYKRIRAREIQPHRQWMIRNYALTFAGVTLRLWVIMMSVAGIEFLDAYRTVAWLCWVPNLIFAEWIVNRIRSGSK